MQEKISSLVIATDQAVKLSKSMINLWYNNYIDRIDIEGRGESLTRLIIQVDDVE
jgi:hypothetical protein